MVEREKAARRCLKQGTDEKRDRDDSAQTLRDDVERVNEGGVIRSERAEDPWRTSVADDVKESRQ